MQPWRVIALAGEPLAGFCDGMVEAFESGAERHAGEQRYYPNPMFEPYQSRRRKIGWDMYGLLGIARGETEKMRAHVSRNLRFFGAPVGLMVLIDKRMEIGSWIDMGMFLQSLAIAARGRGLDTCHMAVFAEFPATVRRLLEISEGDSIVCGMALGFEDKAAPANGLRTEREPASAFSRFQGF